MEEDISFEELLNDSLKTNKKLEKEITGTVISITSSGEIYVDFNYKVDGIIPKGEYSFDENIDPRSELKVGDTITCEVIKRNDGQGNVLLSYKRLRQKLLREAKVKKEEEFWNNTNVGDVFEGTVSSISSYGAFVDINGIQGLLHISEMSWDRDAKVSDILKEGQKIKVIIKEIDKENKRMKLSYEGKGKDPWTTVEYKVGDIVKVTIKRLVPFGAFAELKKGVEGLIHISQISEERITKPEEKLEVGEKVNAKIIDMNLDNKKIELSIRELEGTSNEYSSKEEK